MYKAGLLFLATAFVLSGCGKKPPATDDATDMAAMQLEPGKAQFQAPAEEKLNCPGSFNFPKATNNADIRGIPAGVSLDAAILYIKCQNRQAHYTVEDEGPLFDDGSPGARQDVRVTDGARAAQTLEQAEQFAQARREGLGGDTFTNVHDNYELVTVGAKGAETVSGIWHTETFDDGKMPTAADSGRALITKYGQPSDTSEDASRTRLKWVYDIAGHPMPKSDPKLLRCASNVEATLSHISVSDGCGLTIAAVINKASNDLLAQSIAVGFVDQAQMLAALDRQHQSDLQQTAASKQAAANAATGNGPKL